MRTVYAEPLILLNAALDYLLLLAAGKICALPLRRRRLGLGALWGGVYALLALVWPGLFSLLTVRLLSGAVAVLLAYGPGRGFGRALVSFYAASAALAGLVYVLSGLRGQPQSGGGALPVSLPTLLLSFALGYAALSLAFRRAGQRAERRRLPVRLRLRGKEVEFQALADTGNELLDPVTGKGVLLAEAEVLSPLLDRPEALTDPDQLTALEQLRAQGLACRLLPCRSATEAGALLLVFPPESLWVDGTAREDLLVGVSRHRLCGDGAFRAVVNVH